MTDPTTETAKSSTGLDENVAGALAYFMWFFTGILFLVIEKNSKFVRFHAMQSSLLFGGLFVINLVLGFTLVFAMLLPLVWLVELGLWLFMMYKAFNKETFKLPIIGDIAEKQIAKM